MASSTVLKPMPWSARPGTRQGARDRARCEDEFVVGQRGRARALFVAGRRRVHGRPLGVVDRDDLADDHVAVRQDAAQGHDDVARRDGAGRRLGQERLVRHVRVGGDHDDLHGTAAQLRFQLLLEAQGRVHPDVAAADNENARRFPHPPMTHRTLAFVHSPGKLCDRAEGRTPVGRPGGAYERCAGQQGGRGGREGCNLGGIARVLRSGALRAEPAPSELTPAQLCSCAVGVSGMH